MSLQNLSGDLDFSSDSEDDDYVPSAEDSDDHVVHSEEEGDNLDDDDSKSSRNKKKRKLKDNSLSRKRKGGIRLEDENESDDDSSIEQNGTKDSSEVKTNNTEEDKSRVDALWADFLKDTKSNLKPRNQTTNSNSESSNSLASDAAINHKEAKTEKVTVTKIYQFAGEEVRVQEKVNITENNTKTVETETSSNSNTTPKTDVKTGTELCSSNSKFPIKNPGGLGSIVNKISGKGPKLSTLEKSRLDWNSFKSDEGIVEEIAIHNKGKDGYLEKQAFLERSDLREFERERNLRQNSRSKR